MKNKDQAPSRISLEVGAEFRASHALSGFEVPHFHLWKVKAKFEASLPLESDRVIDLTELQGTLERIFNPVRGCYLNEAFSFSPTSENMALWIWEQILSLLPAAPLVEVKVSLCDLAGNSSGAARVMK